MMILPNFAYGENLLRAPQNSLKNTHKVIIKNTADSINNYNNIVSFPIIFYQNFMSPYWGHKCSHYPSCSSYARLAIKKHGAIIGSMMTFDRLQHESNEAKYSPLIEINSETKVYDPIENNDFWWYKKQDM